MNKDDLIYVLMNEIGLGIDAEHYVIDQDYGTRVFLNGKAIKAKLNGVEPMIRRNEVYFDIDNIKFIRYLFQYYIVKLQKFDNRYFSVFYPVNVNNGCGAIEIKNESEVYRSNIYHNECLRYIDLILKMSGGINSNMDLKPLDYCKVR